MKVFQNILLLFLLVSNTTPSFAKADFSCERLAAYMQAIFGKNVSQDFIAEYLRSKSPESIERLYEDAESYLATKASQRETRDQLPEVRENELFQIVPGISIDVALAAKLIKLNTIPFKVVKIDVKSHVERVYRFSDRKLPDKSEWNSFSQLNLEYLLKLPQARLDVPGIAIQLDSGELMIIDGNHRCARLYFDGVEEFPIYAIPASQINQLRVSH